jgi:hypothetical protein
LILAAVACGTAPARAGWLSDWRYRRAVVVPNPAGQELSEYQVSVRLGADFDFSHAAADGGDLRVTLDDGVTEIPFWIESWSADGSSAWLWVRVPFIPTNGATTYLYYGRNGAAPQASGDATFAAYDGFEEFPAGNPGEWARSAESPVLTVGPPGSWDSGGATFASVIRDEAPGEPGLQRPDLGAQRDRELGRDQGGRPVRRLVQHRRRAALRPRGFARPDPLGTLPDRTDLRLERRDFRRPLLAVLPLQLQARR